MHRSRIGAATLALGIAISAPGCIPIIAGAVAHDTASQKAAQLAAVGFTDETAALALGLTIGEDEQGAVITAVEPASPAAKTRLTAGSRIRSIEGMKVLTRGEALLYLSSRSERITVCVKLPDEEPAYCGHVVPPGQKPNSTAKDPYPTPEPW